MFLGTIVLLMISSWCQPFSFPSIEESSIEDLNKLIQESSHEGPPDPRKTNRGSNARRSVDPTKANPSIPSEDPTKATSSIPSEYPTKGIDERHFDFLEHEDGEDVNDFKSITVASEPMSYRRYEFRHPQSADIQNPFYNLGKKPENLVKTYDFDPEFLIWREVAMHNLCRDYLYLARHKVGWALKRRNPLRNHNRYRMGYLFGRLRRIHTEMLKIVTFANEHGNFIELYPLKTYWKQAYGSPAGYFKDDTLDHSSWNHKVKFERSRYFNITTLMRLYERLSRLDRDSRDTVALLKEIYAAEVKRQKSKHDSISKGLAGVHHVYFVYMLLRSTIRIDVNGNH